MKSLRLILSHPRYFAPAWAFASLNILFGTWAIYIPSVKLKLGINNADLGIALFFLSLGVFTVLPIAAKIINRMGVGKATWYGVLLLCVSALFPFLAPDYYSLLAALFLFGMANGFLDISMNTLVTEIEKEDEEQFMSAAHGFFSLGGVLAGLGSFIIVLLNSAITHMVLAVILVMVVNLFFYTKYYHIKAAPIEKEPFSIKLFRPLLILGIVSFIVMGSEGAIVDWSALYLKEVSLAPEALWGLGFLAFSITMTLGRFFGDDISARLGSISIVTIGSIVAIFGYVLVLTSTTSLSILGFAFTGLGFSVVIPELFRIGGNIKGVASSQGVSFIAGMGYSGFLLAPPVLGFIAQNYSLKGSFVLLLLGAIVVLIATRVLKTRQRRS